MVASLPAESARIALGESQTVDPVGAYRRKEEMGDLRVGPAGKRTNKLGVRLFEQYALCMPLQVLQTLKFCFRSTYEVSLGEE